ncbi:hypothetical protein TIFTF001_026503 [Ficus carica]|uniref:Uncharacterized protein n=1 Tax=Ficus carica TaxID=3494 RepID=A0AA88DLE1_FICCA|nr:hypothetical protein TIFTF001_026503 [Ficus carica]
MDPLSSFRTLKQSPGTVFFAVPVLISWMSLVIALILAILPYENLEEGLVPALLISTPSLFRALVVALNFSFFASISTISLRQKYPRTARCCVAVAVGSSAVGIAILTWLILPACFNFGMSLYVRWSDHFLPVF